MKIILHSFFVSDFRWQLIFKVVLLSKKMMQQTEWPSKTRYEQLMALQIGSGASTFSTMVNVTPWLRRKAAYQSITVKHLGGMVYYNKIRRSPPDHLDFAPLVYVKLVCKLITKSSWIINHHEADLFRLFYSEKVTFVLFSLRIFRLYGKTALKKQVQLWCDLLNCKQILFSKRFFSEKFSSNYD